MAEIFGAVVSGIGLLQLSAELLDGAIRLRGLYQRTKDAPFLLTDLSFELETISLLLKDLERHRQQDRHDTLLMERTMSRCAEKTGLIQAQIDELEGNIRKCSKLGRASVIFKHKELRSMLEDLERWKSSILVAFASYQMKHNVEHTAAIRSIGSALIVHSAQLQNSRAQTLDMSPYIPELDRPGLVAQEVVELEDGDEPDCSSKRRHLITKERENPSEETTYFRTRISLPSWLTRRLTRRVWDFAVTQSHGYWTLTFKTYNDVCWLSPIAQSCMYGDLEAVQELIQEGRASIFDYDSDTNSGTFYWATLSGNIQLCRFLLANGGPTFRSDLGEKFSSCLYSLFSHPKSKAPLESFYRLCIEDFDLDVDIDEDLSQTGEIDCDGDFTEDAPSWKHPLFSFANTECLKIIHRNQTFPYASQPEKRRICLALSTSETLTDRPNTMLHRAGLVELTYNFATSCSDRGESALYVVARNLGLWIYVCLAGEDPNMDFGASHERIKLEWTKFAVKVLQQNDEALCSKSPAGYTPFTILLKHACFRSSGRRYRSEVSKAVVESIERWTGILLEAGIDLLSYASKELKIWSRDYKRGLELDGSVYSSLSAVAPMFARVPLASSMALRWRETLQVYTLVQPPGAWPTHEFKPSTVSWKPNLNEESEGTCQLKRVKTLSSREARDARALSEDCDYALIDQFHTAEDDSGCIAMSFNKKKRVPDRHRRYSSQPPPIHRRLEAYHGVFTPGPRFWLPHFHLCPYDMRFRFDCNLERSDSISTTPSLRDCVRGVSTSDECVQATSRWKGESWEGLQRRTMRS